MAVVRDPFRHETFTARRGGGAFLAVDGSSSRRLCASGQKTMDGAMASVEWPASDRGTGLARQVWADPRPLTYRAT